MGTVVYQLYGSSNATATAVAQLPVVKAGTLRQIAISCYYDYAVTFGALLWEAVLNSVGAAFANVNNPPRNILLAQWTLGANADTVLNLPAVGMNIPVKIGDIFSYNTVLMGTGPTACVVRAAFYVDEAN